MATTNEKRKFVKVQTEEGQVSFPNVWEAKKVNADDKEAKFSSQLIFTIEDTPASKAEGRRKVSIENMRAAVRECLTDVFGADRAKWPAFGDGTQGTLKLPFRDGATEPGKKDQRGYGVGTVFITATSKPKPGIVQAWAGPDNKPAPLTVPSDFYGGCFARFTLNAYYWKYMGKQGVSFGLLNIQKIRDGEPFGNRKNAADEFDAIPEPGQAGGAPAGSPPQAPASGVGV